MNTRRFVSLLLAASCLFPAAASAAAAKAPATATPRSPAAGAKKDPKVDKDEKPEPYRSETCSGLEFRGLGPALTSGRIGDPAIHSKHPATWDVAVSSGGVWKTTNAGAVPELDGGVIVTSAGNGTLSRGSEPGPVHVEG